MPDDVAALLQGYPWLLLVMLVAIVIRYVGQLLSEASESWAKVLGPLGRRWRSKAERRRVVEAADLADLRRQVDNLAPRVESMTEKVAMYDDYLQYDANWHRDIALHGAERGWEFPPPEHISFLAFMRQRQQAGDF